MDGKKGYEEEQTEGPKESHDLLLHGPLCRIREVFFLKTRPSNITRGTLLWTVFLSLEATKDKSTRQSLFVMFESSELGP